MALTFSSGADNYVDVGSGSSLDALTAITIAAWVYPTSSVDGFIYYKADSPGFAAYGGLYLTSSDGIITDRFRATTELKAASNASIITTNAWNFVASTTDSGGVNGDQKLFHGTLSSVVADVGSYSTQQVGSGSVASDAAYNASIGNASPSSPQSWSRFAGRIAWVGVWNRRLSVEELQVQQRRPHVTSGCVGFWHLGKDGTGTQIDFSGNGNSGSVTGATVGDNPPLWLYNTSATSQIFIPAAGVSVTVNPTVQSASFSTATIGFVTDQVLSIAVKSGVFTIPTVGLSTEQILGINPQTASFSLISPSVDLGITVNPTVQTLTFGTQTLTLITDQILAQTAKSLTFSIPAISLSTEQLLDISAKTATLSVVSPTVSIDVTPTVTTQGVTLSQAAISLITDQILSAATQNATFSLPAVTVLVNGDVVVSPANAQTLQMLLGGTPSFVTDAILDISTKTLVLTLNPPEVSTPVPTTATTSKIYLFIGIR